MLVLETALRIRREHASGKAIKAIARDLHLSRKVVRKAIRAPQADMAYRRELQPLPKLGPFQGQLDTGKTHLAGAITANVVRDCARGRYFNTVDLVNRLEEETRLDKAGALATQRSRLDLVVLDELGYLSFAHSGGQLPFRLTSKLYERTSVIVTTDLGW